MNREELKLIDAWLDDDLSDEDAAGLEAWLLADPANIEIFVRESILHRRLRDYHISWTTTERNEEDGLAISDDDVAVPIITTDSRSALRALPSTNFIGGPVFSYMVATVVLCLMLLGAWAYIINHDHSDSSNITRHQPQAPLAPVAPLFVGKITAMQDCQWSAPDTQAFLGATVSLDRRYALASGLLEITYFSGAKVVLEGPCRYKVESSAGGFLERGKLTARIDSAKPQAANPEPRTPNPDSRNSSFIPHPSSLFSVRTPTALVTDLGTEFGVEVDENGDTTTHVFEGKVRVKVGDAKKREQSTELNAGETARVERGKDEVVVNRSADEASNHFTRHIYHRGPIEVYDTGYRIHCGNPDHRWRIIASSNDPDFRPQQAVTTAVITKGFRRNIAGKLLWISTGRDLPLVPEETVYTFQTTFHLNGDPPEGLELHIAFAADNHVDAIRINGKSVAVPKHGYLPPFHKLHELTVTDGFVRGENTLEFDVYNGAPSMPKRPSMMALLVELEANVRKENKKQTDSENHDQSETGGKEANRPRE